MYASMGEETRRGFKSGQRIEFSGTGTITSLHGHNSCFTVEDDAGYTHYVYPASSITLKSTTPADWPPQVGDVWEAGGTEYYARRHSTLPGQVVLVSDGGTNYYRSDFPLFVMKSPTLIRRRGE